METFFLRNENEIFILAKYFLLGIFTLFLLSVLKDIIRILLNNNHLKNVEEKLDLIISQNNQINNIADNTLNEDFLRSEKGNSFVYNDDRKEEEIKNIEEEWEEISQEKESRQWIDYYKEYSKEKKEKLEKISRQETFSFDDFYNMYHYSYNEKIEIPIQEGYFHITELCDVEMEHLKDHTRYAVCKGVRKTNEKIKLIRKDLKTNKILLEHEFDIYETSDKHIYKKFIVYNSVIDGYKRIRFFEKKKEGYENVEIDENGNPYVLTINKDSHGDIYVIRNHKDYEKYAEKIEEKSGTENLF